MTKVLKNDVSKGIEKKSEQGYILEEQVGFVLRQASQRHAAIFANQMASSLTPTQFSVLVKLSQINTCSQNELGRHAAMDQATVKGVVGRLKTRGLVRTVADPNDLRRLLVELTQKGETLASQAIESAFGITEITLKPLSKSERAKLLELLKKLR